MSLNAQQRSLKQAVVDGAHADGFKGLVRIYRQAYTARLAAALRDNFGVVPRVLGDQAFDALALAYIDAFPSTRPSIRWFGDRLPEFMASRDDLVPHPAIADLAALEWALRGAFDAADADALTAADLSKVPLEAWPALVFRPMPGLSMLHVQWNIAPVWRAMQVDDKPELSEPDALDHTLLIWRQELTPRWRTIHAHDEILLRDAIAGHSFAHICERATALVPDAEAALFAANALRGWIDTGLFRR